MIDLKVKAETIAHYERMIAWAAKEPSEAFPERCAEMLSAIGEDWDGKYCPICKTYSDEVVDFTYNSCSKCPICQKTCREQCKETPWEDMHRANSWKEWLEAARKELDFIKSLE